MSDRDDIQKGLPLVAAVAAAVADSVGRQESTALDEDVVHAAGVMRRRIGEFINLAVAGAADSVDYRMFANEIRTTSTVLAQALEVAAGTMQHREALPSETVEPGAPSAQEQREQL